MFTGILNYEFRIVESLSVFGINSVWLLLKRGCVDRTDDEGDIHEWNQPAVFFLLAQAMGKVGKNRGDVFFSFYAEAEEAFYLRSFIRGKMLKRIAKAGSNMMLAVTVNNFKIVEGLNCQLDIAYDFAERRVMLIINAEQSVVDLTKDESAEVREDFFVGGFFD